MTTISIQLDDAKADILREKAKQYGISLDQLVAASLEDLLAQPDAEFEEAMKYVLEKNIELYKTLT